MTNYTNKILSKSTIYLFIISICILFCSFNVNASENKNVIRVGYPSQMGLTEITGSGDYRGYTYDYLMEIQKYTNWEYEFVTLPGDENEQLSEMFTMLKNGEIDLMGGMTYNEDLAQIYDFSGFNYGTSYYILCALDEMTEINSNSYYNFNPLRVAVYSTRQIRNEKLDQFAATSGITVEQIFCDSEEKQLESLQNGKADVLLTNEVSYKSDNLVTVAKFSPTPFYFATTKGNKEVANQINAALSNISKSNPSFMLNLQNKYFTTDSKRLIFTNEELEYIKETGTVDVAAFGGKVPIQYIDEKTKEAKGISIDVLKYIEEKTGLKFNVKMTDSFEEYEKLVKKDNTKLVLGVKDSLNEYEWQNMTTTIEYLSVPMSVVYRINDTIDEVIGKRLAISKGSAYDGTYKGKVFYKDTVIDCLRAIETKEADYSYVNAYSAQYYISSPECNSLSSIPQSGEWTQDFSIGITDSNDYVLLSILNKTIQSFKDSDRLQDYLFSNAYRQKDITLLSYIKYNPLQFIAITGLVLLIVSIVVIVMLRNQDYRNNKIREIENERYRQISELSNEYLFEYDIDADIMRFSDKCAEFLKSRKEIKALSKIDADGSNYLRLLMKAENVMEERLIQLEDKSERWIKIVSKSITKEDGAPVYLVGKFIDIQKEREERELLLIKAQKDDLTGLYNISTFREKTDSILNSDEAENYALLIMDVDHFKNINDTYGHYTGDYVLKEIGRIYNETFDDKDISGRLGGDEFVAFINYSKNRDIIDEKCKKIRETVKKITFENQTGKITVSMGVSPAKAKTNFDIVYKNADAMLYDVKNSTRDGYKIDRV